jgi:hypothetical protein
MGNKQTPDKINIKNTGRTDSLTHFIASMNALHTRADYSNDTCPKQIYSLNSALLEVSMALYLISYDIAEKMRLSTHRFGTDLLRALQFLPYSPDTQSYTSEGS